MTIEKHPSIPFIEIGTSLDYGMRDGYADDPCALVSEDEWTFELDGIRGGVICSSREQAIELAEKAFFLDTLDAVEVQISSSIAIGNHQFALHLAERRGYWLGRRDEAVNIRNFLSPAIKTLSTFIR